MPHHKPHKKSQENPKLIVDRRWFVVGCTLALSPVGHAVAEQPKSTSKDQPTPAEKADDMAGMTELKTQKSSANLMGAEGGPAEVWTYNGITPGPVLRVKQGEQLKVRLVNELDRDTTIHWHGLRLENSMDGTELTQDPVKPGDSFDYVFTAPDAGTFWYHPHVNSAIAVDHGLYGALIVEENKPLSDHEDIIMVLDDWQLKNDGQIDEESYGNLMVAAHAGRIGNWFTVNSTSRPTYRAPAKKPVRLRLINCANSMVISLVIKGPKAALIAIDGQPIDAIGLSDKPNILPPGGRFDVVLAASTERCRISALIDREELELAYVERDGKAPKNPPSIEQALVLPKNPLPEKLPLEKAHKVTLTMSGGAMGGMDGAMLNGEKMTMRQLVQKGYAWAFNDTAGMPEDPLFKVDKGRVVAIEMINNTAWPHAIHLHGHHVKVVVRDDNSVSDENWRDVVLMAPKETLTIAFVADNPGKWMLHCHMLEHQEAGMMSWFEVI